jgi:hypothetical protein
MLTGSDRARMSLASVSGHWDSLDSRKNRLKERKLRQELGRRVLLVCSSSRMRINLIASLPKN